MKKTATQVIMVIGALIAVIGIIVDAILSGSPIIAFSIVDLSAVAAVLAIAFVFGKKELLVTIGYLLAAIIGACALTALMTPTKIVIDSYYGQTYYYSYNLSVTGIGFIVMGVAALIYFFVKMLKCFGFVRTGKNAETGDVVAVLNKYKEMETEKIITEEEFESLKGKILKGADKEVSSVEDLKKWKKLFDQKVITEEEFSSVKSKIFAK